MTALGDGFIMDFSFFGTYIAFYLFVFLTANATLGFKAGESVIIRMGQGLIYSWHNRLHGFINY